METITTATTFVKFSEQLFCSRYNFSFKSSTQFGNSSSYSLFFNTGRNTVTTCSVVTALASVGLRINVLATTLP